MAFSLYGRWYSWRQRWAVIFKAYWRYVPNRWYLLVSLIAQISLWFFAYQMFRAVGADLFLAHYNVDFGIDSIGGSQRAFNVPLLATAVFLLNWLIVILVVRREQAHFLAHACGLATLLAQVLAALALMSLYLINFIA